MIFLNQEDFLCLVYSQKINISLAECDFSMYLYALQYYLSIFKRILCFFQNLYQFNALKNVIPKYDQERKLLLYIFFQIHLLT